MGIKDNWRGRLFKIGDVYEYPLGRTVTTADNAWFTLLTQKTVPIHFDHHVSAQTELGKPLVNSTFTVALATGQSVTDVSQNVFANLERDESASWHLYSGATRSTLNLSSWRNGRPSRGRASASLP